MEKKEKKCNARNPIVELWKISTKLPYKVEKQEKTRKKSYRIINKVSELKKI